MAKPFNKVRREKQLEFLFACDSRESLGKESLYVIRADDGRTDSCRCAGTAMMLLDTKYPATNVWLNKGY